MCHCSVSGGISAKTGLETAVGVNGLFSPPTNSSFKSPDLTNSVHWDLCGGPGIKTADRGLKRQTGDLYGGLGFIRSPDVGSSVVFE